MEIFILNYKEEVKRLISENYEPADVLSKEFKFTYEALIELGFEPKEEEPLVYFWYFKRKNNM
jgi:hypothetical protein